MTQAGSKQGAQPSWFNQEVEVLFQPEQIARRVQDLARRIEEDYRGKTPHLVCVLENGFVFVADLVRALNLPVICQFIKPRFTEQVGRTGSVVQIFFSPEIEVKGQHVLLVEGILQSGVTTEFLMRNMLARGAASVKLVCFLDRQEARRVHMQPDYSGFSIQEGFVVGYGLGAPHLGRNLPYLGLLARPPAETADKAEMKDKELHT